MLTVSSRLAALFNISAQEADRHTEAINALTEYLGLGSYKDWSEDKKLEFLVSELRGKRPLIPNNIELSEPVREVIDTFKIAAELGAGSLGAYVISMASEVSALWERSSPSRGQVLATGSDLMRRTSSGMDAKGSCEVFT